MLLHCGEERVTVKVLRSIVRGPLEPHVAGFAEELLRQGYSDPHRLRFRTAYVRAFDEHPVDTLRH